MQGVIVGEMDPFTFAFADTTDEGPHVTAFVAVRIKCDDVPCITVERARTSTFDHSEDGGMFVRAAFDTPWPRKVDGYYDLLSEVHAHRDLHTKCVQAAQARDDAAGELAKLEEAEQGSSSLNGPLNAAAERQLSQAEDKTAACEREFERIHAECSRAGRERKRSVQTHCKRHMPGLTEALGNAGLEKDMKMIGKDGTVYTMTTVDVLLAMLMRALYPANTCGTSRCRAGDRVWHTVP
jgi:hypothetical protein